MGDSSAVGGLSFSSSGSADAGSADWLAPPGVSSARVTTTAALATKMRAKRIANPKLFVRVIRSEAYPMHLAVSLAARAFAVPNGNVPHRRGSGRGGLPAEHVIRRPAGDPGGGRVVPASRLGHRLGKRCRGSGHDRELHGSDLDVRRSVHLVGPPWTVSFGGADHGAVVLPRYERRPVAPIGRPTVSVLGEASEGRRAG